MKVESRGLADSVPPRYERKQSRMTSGLCLTLVHVYLLHVHRKVWRLVLLFLRLCLESELYMCILYVSFDSFSNGSAQISACDYFLDVRFKAHGSLFSTRLKVEVWSFGVGLVRLWVRAATSGFLRMSATESI